MWRWGALGMGVKVKLGTIAPVVMKLEASPWEVPEGATIPKSRVWHAQRGWRNNKSASGILGGSTRNPSQTVAGSGPGRSRRVSRIGIPW
jgi:hypothetical protein